MSADVRIDVLKGRVSIRYADGVRPPAGVASALRELVPALQRAVAPALPPRSTWPAEWCEIYDERVAICLADGTCTEAEAEAIADTELRVWAWVSG
jgi:hypothetical protein